MEAIKALSSENTGEDDQMLQIELEAAEALAALAHVAAGGESVSELLKVESIAGNSCFGSIEPFSKRSINVDEDQVDFRQKDSEKTCIWIAKPTTNEQKTELRSDASYFTKYSSSGGTKCKKTLTEAEKEERKIRRVLANRESARQTIRRRQAIYEELARKAGDLAWENRNLKKKKEMASKEVELLKTTNECLKAQMLKVMMVKSGDIHGNTCSSSSNFPNMMCNQSSFLPFTWPSLFVLPRPCLFSFLQNNNINQHNSRSFNLNEKPVDSSPGHVLSVMHKSHQVPSVCLTKTVCDMAAATEARKRRKQLKMKKGYLLPTTKDV